MGMGNDEPATLTPLGQALTDRFGEIERRLGNLEGELQELTMDLGRHDCWHDKEFAAINKSLERLEKVFFRQPVGPGGVGI